MVRTLRCRTEATGDLRHRHHIRDLPPFGGIREGEPGSLDGYDSNPSPSEMLLSALGACLATSIQASAVARSIPIRSLEIELNGDIDFGSLWGASGPDVHSSGFEAISIVVRIEADVPRSTLKAIVDHATLRSPVGNTLHDPVHLDVVLAE